MNHIFFINWNRAKKLNQILIIFIKSSVCSIREIIFRKKIHCSVIIITSNLVPRAILKNGYGILGFWKFFLDLICRLKTN